MKKTDSITADRFVLLRLCAVAGLLSSTAFADSEFGYAVNTSDQGGFGAYLIEKSGLVVPQPYQLAPVDAGPPTAVSKGKFLVDLNTSFELDEYYLFCYRIQPDGTLAYASQTYYPFPNGDPTALAYLGLMHENGDYLYIVNVFAEGSSTQSTLTAMRIDANGSMNRVSSSEYKIGTTVGQIIGDASGKFIYGLDNGTQSIVGCRIDGDGAPEAIPGWSFPNDINVIAMALAPDRNYLYAFYQSVSPSGGSTEMLAVFKVGDQGNLVPVPGSPFRNDAAFSQITRLIISPNGKYAYAPIAPGFPQLAKVGIFNVEANGQLTPLSSSPVVIGSSATQSFYPFWCTIDPAGKLFFASFDAGIYPYSIREDGMVTATPGTLLPSAASLSAFTHSGGGLGR
jgi:6-phosphogluconolactonase (cycloisomerase 2 family)